MSLPVFLDVQTAAERLRGHAHRTPVLRSATADARAGASLVFKCENFQRMGAFKFRGAFNAIARLSPTQQRAGVITFSSGNHAQAIALAARELGVTATIVMPSDAPAAKLAATRDYGGEIVAYDRFGEDREALARRIAGERGATLIPPYDHADVIAGQGTAALELFEEVGALDALFVCLGGGGLLAGCALAAQQMAPACAVYGVEPEAGDDGRQSLRAGRIVTIAVPRTIADGAMTTHLGALTFPIIRERVRDILTVDDRQLVQAMRFFAERMKMVVEPTGCLAAAGAFAAAPRWRGRRVGVIVSGGNVDLAAYAGWIGSG
ncbi:MAG: threo-3-hydroxy-L-aspartate ammonia-lyase [Burkholderiaceae bacterium]|nr:threo-3-hydroxy-L-aspartate ammonia-lyase [Burkholderiaceae bacterium]MEB2349815.1 threo-3-hydroxy-L-aspartate ammonia-lyase [Burkholderiaceae bacterium]